MINIRLFKGEKTEKNNVYFQVGENEKKLLNFDELKIFAKNILNDIKNSIDNEYEISADKGLELYQETIQNIISGIKSDLELQNLYKENQPAL